MLISQELIECRKQEIRPCVPFAPTGWVKLDNLPMFNADSYNPPDRYRNLLQRLLLCGKIM